MGWLGLLIVVLAIALIAANFQRAVRSSERKRQTKEWQDARGEGQNITDLGGSTPRLRVPA
jgi:hypothetical protein